MQCGKHIGKHLPVFTCVENPYDVSTSKVCWKYGIYFQDMYCSIFIIESIVLFIIEKIIQSPSKNSTNLTSMPIVRDNQYMCD